jgi:hypothetical protein
VITAISADSHVTEPGDCYLPYIDPAFRDRAPVAVTDTTMGAAMAVDRGTMTVPYGMIAAAGRSWDQISPFIHVGWDELHAGGWDSRARLTEQDRDGVLVEVLYPSVGMLLCNHPDADYKHACFQAYNQWMAEYMSVAPDRLLGIGQTALRSVEEGIEDLESMKALGLKASCCPGTPRAPKTGTTTIPAGTRSGARPSSSTSRCRSTSSRAVRGRSAVPTSAGRR